jgi:hypothetical protein
METLKKMEDMAVADLKSGAVVVRGASGKVTINETSDFDTKHGNLSEIASGNQSPVILHGDEFSYPN